MLPTTFRKSHPLVGSKGKCYIKKSVMTSIVCKETLSSNEKSKLMDTNVNASCIDPQHQTSFHEQRWRVIFPFLQEIPTPFVVHKKQGSIATLSTRPSELSLETIDNSPPQSILRLKPHSSRSTSDRIPTGYQNSVRFHEEVEIKSYEISAFEKRGENWYHHSELRQMKRKVIYQRNNDHIQFSLFKAKYASYNELLVSTIRNILVVDSHSIFRLLFLKSLKQLMPHVQVTLAESGEEAWGIIQRSERDTSEKNEFDEASHYFDIIITEERLMHGNKGPENKKQMGNNMTGSNLLKQIHREQKIMSAISSRKCSLKNFNKKPLPNQHYFFNKKTLPNRHSLLIGVSAYLDIDYKKLKESGADLMWSKPPPPMDGNLQSLLLETILQKRNFMISK